MSRSRRSRAVLLALGLVPAAAHAGAVLDVSGSVLATEPRLRVEVVVVNRGDGPASAVDLGGELLGQQRSARIGRGIAPGATGTAVMEFDTAGARPGVHALTLLLEHPIAGTPDAAGNPPVDSQRAWLLIALGAPADPAVRLSAAPLAIDVRGRLAVSVESADATAHAIRLRALTARGLRVEPTAVEVKVPAEGAVRAAIDVMRAGAPRATRHGVLVVAESIGEPLVRTTVSTVSIDVKADPSLLPRLRRPVLVLALLLLAVALGTELWRARRRT